MDKITVKNIGVGVFAEGVVGVVRVAISFGYRGGFAFALFGFDFGEGGSGVVAEEKDGVKKWDLPTV